VIDWTVAAWLAVSAAAASWLVYLGLVDFDTEDDVWCLMVGPIPPFSPTGLSVSLIFDARPAEELPFGGLLCGGGDGVFILGIWRFGVVFDTSDDDSNIGPPAYAP
jgi:hypothetical protein